MLGTLCLSTKEPITTKHRFSGSICAGFGVPLLQDPKLTRQIPRKRRTRTEKKNTGQEPEQKRQNTGVRVLPVAQCAAADGRRATGDARWANTNDPPEGSWGVGQLDTSYRVYYHQSYTISTTEEARDQVTPFVSSIQCPIEGGEFEQKETIILPSKAHIGSASRSSTDLT